MRRSKTQAVYKYLPGMWISEKNDSTRTVTAEIRNWNYKKMDNIYKSFINTEIERQIRLFEARGGDITSFRLDGDSPFEIVEPACNEGIPDIIGVLSPLLFYCSTCHHAFQKRNVGDVNNGTWICPFCKNKNVKQLQMIYACECGYAEPIKMPFVKGVSSDELLYKPNESSYKMFYKEGGNEKPAEFVRICPNCNSRLVPDNAESSRNYKPFFLRIINLVNKESGDFYEKGLDAQKIVVARWFGKVSQADYIKVLENVDLAFSDAFKSDSQRQEAENQARSLIAIGVITPDQFETTVRGLLKGKTNTFSAETLAAACDELFPAKQSDPVAYSAWIGSHAYRLMQYDTLKYAKSIITLEDIITKQLELDFIEDKSEIISMHDRLGITNMQVSGDIEIINCTYGYTRRIVDPKNNQNKNTRLKLNSFDRTKDGSASLVFGAKLETEGLLFEFNQKKIIEWLYRNGLITEAQLPDLEDAVSVKLWFAENVHGDAITSFGEIDDSERITKNVFSLLHSISHAFLNACGEISGLAVTSLTEIIIVETASIYIYAQTSQGIPLGALSGLAENNYMQFLERAFKESRSCMYDPICMERDDTRCNACLIIPEISCNHFNNGLGRKYLYTFNEMDDPMIGFWEM